MVDSKRHDGHGLSMHDESMERSYRPEIDGNMLGVDSADVERKRKMWRLRIIVLVALAAAVLAAGVLVASNLGSQGQAQSGSPLQTPAATTAPATITATPTASATAPATTVATAEPGASTTATPDLRWTSFVSASAHAQFDLPMGWTATDVPAGTASNPASGIQVKDEAGRVLAKFYHGAGGGVGGACGPGTYKQTELDKAATSLTGQWVTTSQARFSFRVLDQTAQGGGIGYQIGLVDKSSGEVRDSCLMYSFVAGAPKGTLSFATSDAQAPGSRTFSTMAEATQYMQTPEYQKLKRMITSLQLTQ
ncbi:hypothetical protein [Arthrobacter sp. MMS18-M83]|uniref:hypothetical protein n=1 Tax=Arthrobacter sp. MMS18-M83 TaxID=2996261 RepID=UPI00227CAE44|nr:hypothetical protein [Arthrobacter sp. MMS18-M83]WAH97954.1 hypothetical protein OW521_03455 [Arthrobacter sp. MMS18-M83]